jgi:hypothetical protein
MDFEAGKLFILNINSDIELVCNIVIKRIFFYMINENFMRTQ